MTMFRYFPDNEGWSYHFAARIVNVAQLGGADFTKPIELRRRSKPRSAPAGSSPRWMPTCATC